MTSVTWTVQLAVGVVFLLAGASKAGHPLAFARAVADYGILPGHAAATTFALLLIPAELIVGLAHLTAWRLTLWAPAGLLLLVTFAIAVAVTLHRGCAVPCHCFGGGDETISSRTLIRLGLMIAGEIAIVAAGPSTLTVAAMTAAEAARAAVLTISLLAAAAWIVSVPDLIDLARRRFAGDSGEQGGARTA